MRRLIVTLLAATMLLPTAAGAQDRGDGPRDRAPRGGASPDGRPDGGPNGGANVGANVGEVRQRPWRDQMQPMGGGAVDPRARYDRAPDRPSPRQADAPRQDDGRGNDGRWNAGARPDRNGPDRQDRNGADWSRGGVDTGARYGIQTRDGADDRRRDDPRGWDDRRDDDRRYDPRANDDRRYEDGRRTGSTWYSDRDTGNRGGWNRGWRGETRYDWNRYRTTHRDAYRLPRYYAPSGWGGGYRRFRVGTRLSAGLWGQNYWIADPFAYRLPEAYGPYRWVRYYGDALLIDLRTGLVVDTVYDIFW